MTDLNQKAQHFHSSSAGYITRLSVLTVAIMLGAMFVPHIEVSSFWAVLLTAIVLSLLNNILRPILIVLTLPFTIFSLGLFLFVINASLILLSSAIVHGFHVDTFGAALLLSLIISAVSYILELPQRFLNRKHIHPQSNTDTTSNDDDFTPYEEIND